LEDIFEPEESDKTRNEDPNWSMAKSKPLTAADLSDSVTFYSCDHCEKKFKTERALQRHKDQIKKDAAVKFSCENCNRSFPNEVQLGSHIDGPQCKSLKKRRKKASILVKKPKKALKAAAALSKEMYQACPVCFRQFAMATRFDQHMELHKSRMENLYRYVSTLTTELSRVLASTPVQTKKLTNFKFTYSSLDGNIGFLKWS
jgi:hypothetical protein